MEPKTPSHFENRRQRFEFAPIDGQGFKELAFAGLTWLKTNAQLVNSLNVFPVPDGDTGTNMVLTMQAAYQEIAESTESNLGKLVHSLAHGALMGARGNSGVILSQLWRGFSRALDDQPNLTPELMARAFGAARETAYRGVVRPVEGTILTVAKDVALAAEQAVKSTNDMVTFMEWIVSAAGESVERTPELLPILREAGVVDSGGKGFYFILEGMLRYMNEQSLDVSTLAVKPLSAMSLENTMEAVEPGQDYEVIVDFRPHKPLDLQAFYAELEQMGTSIQVGEGDGMYRVHIHVPLDNRYMPIEYTLGIGTITKVYMENLVAQMESLEKTEPVKLNPVEPGQIAVVVVSPGEGFSRVFASLGANALVAGGQTMNPSTQEILSAFENLPTDNIVILPNNKNIILAANNAAELSVKKVKVIPSRTLPQGIAALLNLDAFGELEDAVEVMTAALDSVQTGEITTATRDVEIDGVQVKNGEIIALHNGKLVLSAPDLLTGCSAFFEHIGIEDYELISMFYGSDLTQELAEQIKQTIQEKYPDHEVELQAGGQPHYQFIISVE